MGSTAVRIVQEATCPVLSIREGFNFHKDLERILVPLNMTTNSRQKLPVAVRWQRLSVLQYMCLDNMKIARKHKQLAYI